MKQIFKHISETYIERLTSLSKRSEIWIKTTDNYPANLDYKTFPSTLITKESGDLGLALLWLVQTTLVQPLIKRFHREKTNVLGALAHSEDPKDPVLLEIHERTITLRGIKKYITGGREAEVLFVTCRKVDNDSIQHLVMIKKDDIDSSTLKDLHLEALKTVSHGSLHLKDLTLPKERLLSIEGSELKRHVKIWGIIERTMIMDAALGLVHYISRELNKSFNAKELSETIQESLKDQIKAAQSGQRISIPPIDLKEFSQIIKDASQTAQESSDPAMNERAKDLSFILKLG